MTAPETLWSALPLPAITVDQAGCVTGCNPAAEAWFNLSTKKLIGAPMADILSADPALAPVLARMRGGETPVRIRGARITMGAQIRNGALHLAPLDRTGEALILIQPDEDSGSHDMTGAAKSAIGMAEMLAHEIKNPLTGITGAAQLLSMNLDPSDAEMTDLIVAESRRILDLLAQVEHFGNLLPPNRMAVNVHDVLDQARNSAALGFASGVRIERIYDPSLPATYCDGDQLVQVFQNLLKNASEAMKQAKTKDPSIEIHTFYDSGMRRRTGGDMGTPLPLQVEIRDNGPGLPIEIADEIFEPFVSGRENGTGLGLALVSKILAENDGWINVRSTPGQTVFRVSLPLEPRPEGD